VACWATSWGSNPASASSRWKKRSSYNIRNSTGLPREQRVGGTAIGVTGQDLTRARSVHRTPYGPVKVGTARGIYLGAKSIWPDATATFPTAGTSSHCLGV